MDKKLSHLNADGNPSMVDVSQKPITERSATAQAVVELGQEILALLEKGEVNTKKGPVFQTAILAGIMGAKKTGELIPLCHPMGLDNCQITIERKSDTAIQIECTASISAKTGVEMEALTGASIAALTIYDMCKALSHDIVIQEIKLLRKTGGKKDFIRNPTT